MQQSLYPSISFFFSSHCLRAVGEWSHSAPLGQLRPATLWGISGTMQERGDGNVSLGNVRGFCMCACMSMCFQPTPPCHSSSETECVFVLCLCVWVRLTRKLKSDDGVQLCVYQSKCQTDLSQT